MTPCLSNKGHEVITILRYVHGAKTIKLYSAGRGGGMSKNLVQGPTILSMSFYPDFILILSKFYLDEI